MRAPQPIRDEHAELLGHIEHLAQAARAMPALSEPERRALCDRIVMVLRGTLVPHATAEEEMLYPAWAQLIGLGDAAVPMIDDHEAIVARMERLEATAAGDGDALRELLSGAARADPGAGRRPCPRAPTPADRRTSP